MLAQELNKPVIKKFKKWKVYARFEDNIWTANLAEMALLFSFSSVIKNFFINFSSNVLGLNHLWQIKKTKIVLHGFIEIISKYKLWVDQGEMQKWLDDNDILMYSTYNEGNSVVAERFTRTPQGKIYKKMTTCIRQVGRCIQ